MNSAELPPLPKGWVWTEIGAIGEVVTGKTPSTSMREFYGNTVPFVKPGDLDVTGLVVSSEQGLSEEGVRRARVVPPHTVMVTSIGTIGKTGISGTHVVTNQQINSVIPTRGVDPFYLYYYCRSDFFQGTAMASASATTIAILNKSRFERLPVPLAPLSEQKRIVRKIEELFEELRVARQALDQVPPLMKQFRRSILAATFRGELTSRKPKDEQSVNPPGQGLIGVPSVPPVEETLPPGWTWMTLGQLCQTNRPIIYGIIKPGKQIDGGVPYVRINEMQSGIVDMKNLRRTSTERAEKFKRATLKAGDLLISKDGTIGKVAIVPPELEGGNITQHIVRVSVDPSYNRDYVMWAIRSPSCQQWLSDATRGVALRGVNVEDFRRMPIPMALRKEQDDIARILKELFGWTDQAEDSVQESLKRTNVLEQSLLAKAFKGELLSQDPNDEPATVLLENKRQRPELTRR